MDLNVDRFEAISRLEALRGRGLHQVAEELGVPFYGQTGNINKGWAGQALEVYLGKSLDTSRHPDFGDWELKVVPLKRLKNGHLRFKETMAVTMIDRHADGAIPFEDSHLLAKLRRFVLVARIVGSTAHEPTYIHSVSAIDLKGALCDAVKADYELIQDCLNDPHRGFSKLTGYMGQFIQPRTKGGGNSDTRAYYARKEFLAKYIDLE